MTDHGKKSRGPERAAERAKEKERFLMLLAEGEPITRAATAVGLTRHTLYGWRKSDAQFARAWDEAWEQGADLLEAVALKRALNGSDLLLIFLLKGRRPHRYRDNVRHEIDHRVTVSVEDARAQLLARLKAGGEQPVIDGQAQRALPAAPSKDGNS